MVENIFEPIKKHKIGKETVVLYDDYVEQLVKISSHFTILEGKYKELTQK